MSAEDRPFPLKLVPVIKPAASPTPQVTITVLNLPGAVTDVVQLSIFLNIQPLFEIPFAPATAGLFTLTAEIVSGNLAFFTTLWNQKIQHILH